MMLKKYPAALAALALVVVAGAPAFADVPKMKTFDQLDTNRDHRATNLEWMTGMNGAPAKMVKDGWTAADVDKNGNVDKIEYENWLATMRVAAGKTRMKIYDQVDINKDHRITKVEWNAAMTGISSKLMNSGWNAADADKNGNVDKSEYDSWTKKMSLRGMKHK